MSSDGEANPRQVYRVSLTRRTSVPVGFDFHDDDIVKNSLVNQLPLATDQNTSNYLYKARITLTQFYQKHTNTIGWCSSIFLHLAFIVYFTYASYYQITQSSNIWDWCNGYGFLIVYFIFVYIFFFFYYVHPYIKWPSRDSRIGRLVICDFHSRYTNYALIITFIVLYLLFLFFDTKGHRERCISLIGYIFFMAIGYLFCVHPGNINWKPVVIGTVIQILFGLFTIRSSFGRGIFVCLGNKVTTFLNFALNGAEFVYGNFLVLGVNDKIPSVFAFNALSVVYFMSFMVNILFYYGIIQSIVTNLGWVLGRIMGTTICESANCIANIFLGMTESPLLLKPYLAKLTKCEFHAVMLSGFASVSGTVLAAYIQLGAKASHLITACVMTAPATLAYAKLSYPETEESQNTIDTIEKIETEDTSVLDAASKGANMGVSIVTGVIANMIAFIAFVAFLNATINWFGVQVGFDVITFEWIMTQFFTPISWMMGVEWAQCGYVGNLIALKTVISEFVAYQRLHDYKEQGLLTARSEMISTYAVCGFSNPGSVGIMIGIMSTLVPEKSQEITDLSIRAFMGGAIVCFMTACVAGMLADGSEFD